MIGVSQRPGMIIELLFRFLYLIFDRVLEVHQQVAGLLSDQFSGGVGGDPGDVHLAVAVVDHHENVEAAQEDGVDVGEVDREDRVGLRSEELSLGRSRPSRAGSTPAALRIFRTVEAATRCASPTSSP